MVSSSVWRRHKTLHDKAVSSKLPQQRDGRVQKTQRQKVCLLMDASGWQVSTAAGQRLQGQLSIRFKKNLLFGCPEDGEQQLGDPRVEKR